MALKFIPKFTIAAVIADVSRKVKVLEDVVIERLQQVGEQFVADARNNGTYTDRTGNLRSSIGYVIYKDGKSIEENFKEKGSGTDKKTGVSKAEQVAEQVQVPQKGFCLVVVAGMNYAIYVEAKNYDVITGSSYEAETNLKEAIKFIKQNL